MTNPPEYALGRAAEGEGLVPPPGQPGALDGPESLEIEFTVENNTNFVRKEVLGVMCPFPDGANGIMPSELSDYHFKFDRATEILEAGNASGAGTLTGTLRWPLDLGIQLEPGRVKLHYTIFNSTAGEYQQIEVGDTGVGLFLPAFGLNNVTSTIDYTTGAYSITFIANRVNAFRVFLEYGLSNAESYPTDWTVLTTWPGPGQGRVRLAKAWMGRVAGDGVEIPAQSIAAGATFNNGAQNLAGGFGRIRMRSILKLIKDASLTASLPTHTPDAAVTVGLTQSTPSNITSTVFDHFGNAYSVNLLDTTKWYEDDLLEDTAWMKVYRRRSYHTLEKGSSVAAHVNRDFLAVTWYLYVPHNSRMVDMEIRLCNDYCGSDPYEHTTTQQIGTGNANATTFNFGLTDIFFGDGTNAGGHVRRESLTIDTVVTDFSAPFTVPVSARDGSQSGQLYDVENAQTQLTGLPGVGSQVNSNTSSVTHTTGLGVVNFNNPPRNLEPVNATYNHYYKTLDTGDGGTSYSGTFDQRPSAKSVHIQVGNGAGVQGKDDGDGNIIPYVVTHVDDEVVASGDGSTANLTGTLSNTPAVKGSVLLVVSGTVSDPLATVWCRDDGSGTLTGRGLAASPTSTIDYATGAIDLYLNSAPAAYETLYADYDYDPNAVGSTPVIAGTVNYTSGAVSLTFASSVSAGTAIRGSFIYNRLSTSFDQDPNMHPLGMVGLTKWQMYLRNNQITTPAENAGAIIEGNDSYQGYVSLLSPGPVDVIDFLWSKGEAHAEYIATGDGATNSFTYTTRRSSVLGGSAVITDGSQTITDDGAGGFTGAVGGGPNTITYANGAIAFTFTAPPANGAEIRISYRDNQPTIAPGSTGVFVPENLCDGSSIPRLLKLYFGSGATSTEDDYFTAKMVQQLTPIATRECYSTTRAYHLFEGALKFQTPVQIRDFRTHRSAADEDIATGDIPWPLSTNEQGKGWAATTNFRSTPIGGVWNNNGTVTSAPAGDPNISGGSGGDKGVRAHWRWNEHQTPPNSGGATRNSHQHMQHPWYSQSWRSVRYCYHAALWCYNRPNQTRWNVAMDFRWRSRAWYSFTGLIGGVGLHPIVNTGFGFTYGTTQQFMNRHHRGAWGQGTATVTRGNAVVSLSDGSSEIVSYAGGGGTNAQQLKTRTGANLVEGAKRVVFDGSRRVYTFTGGPGGSAGNWTITLTQPYQGQTASNVNFALVTDCIAGDQPYPRNDNNNYALARVRFQHPIYQHGFECDNLSHQAQDSVFEAWNLTGSWMLWDKVRHFAEFDVGLYFKDQPANGLVMTGEQYTDEMRANAWWSKNVLIGYLVTKYLSTQPNFGFLRPLEYDDAATRYKEALKRRWGWRLQRKTPNGLWGVPMTVEQGVQQIAPNDCDVSDGVASGNKSDWSDARVVGSFDPQFGGGTPAFGGGVSVSNGAGGSQQAISETQVKWGEQGFNYGALWQVNYLSTYYVVGWREFRFDSAPMHLIPGSTNTEVAIANPPTQTLSGFAQICWRLSLGAADWVIDYGFVFNRTPITSRNQPGFNANVIGAFPPVGALGQGTSGVGATGWPIESILAPGSPPPVVQIELMSPEPDWTAYGVTSENTPTNVFYYRLGYRSNVSGAPAGANTFEQQNDIDQMGYQIPGTGRYAGRSGVDVSSFDNGYMVPAILSPPGSRTTPTTPNPGQQYYADPNTYAINIRASERLENWNTVGTTILDLGLQEAQGKNLGTAVILAFAVRYHPDQARRAKAAQILNSAILQNLAFTTLRQDWNPTGGRLYDPSNRGFRMEYEGGFFGSILGDFPFVPGQQSGGDPTYWWNTSWVRRRQLSSTTVHSAYVGGQDVLRVNLSTYSIPAQTQGAPGFGDIRLIHQDTDVISTELEWVVRQEVDGDWILFFKPLNIAENVEIGTDPFTRYYIYYSNPSAGLPLTWNNLESIDGPYSVDSPAETIALWNFPAGSFTSDASGNGYTLFNSAAPLTLPRTGPLGLGLYSTIAGFTFSAYGNTSQFFPQTSSFTIEYWWNPETAKFYWDVLYRLWFLGEYHGIFTIIDETRLPHFHYMTGGFPDFSAFNLKLRSTFDSGTTTIPEIPGPNGVLLAEAGFVGDGSTTAFSGSLGAASEPGTVFVGISNDFATYGSDDSNGVITGPGIAASPTSTIDYSTGAIELYFESAPEAYGGSPGDSGRIDVYYNTAGTGTNTWRFNEWNHVKLVYDFNNDVSAYLNGNLVTAPLPATGSIRTLSPAASQYTAVGILSLVTTNVGAINPGDRTVFGLGPSSSIAEFRVSSVARTNTYKVADPIVLGLEQEESISQTTELDLAVAGTISFRETRAISCDGIVAANDLEVVLSCGGTVLEDTEYNVELLLATTGEVATTGTVFLPSSGGVSVVDIPVLLPSSGAAFAPGAVSLSQDGILAIADLPVTLASDGILAIADLPVVLTADGILAIADLPAALPGDGILLEIDIPASVDCEGYILTNENVELPLSGDGWIAGTLVYNLEVAIGCIGEVVDPVETDKLLPIASAGYVLLKQNAPLPLPTSGAASHIIPLPIPTSGIISINDLPEILPGDGIILIQDNTVALPCDGEVSMVGLVTLLLPSGGAVITVESVSLSGDGVLQIQNIEVALSGDGAVVTVETVLLPCGATVQANDRTVLLPSGGWVQLRNSLALPTSGILSFLDREVALSGDGILSFVDLEVALSGDGTIIFKDQTVSLPCEGDVFTLDEAFLSLPGTGSVATQGSVSLSQDGILAIADLPVLLPGTGAVAAPGVVSLPTGAYIYSNLDAEESVPCTGEVSTIGYAVLPGDGVISVTGEESLSCSGFVIDPTDVLSSSSPATVTARRRPS